MAEPCAALPALHLDNTLGAAYIGNILAALLYGFTNVQMYLFFTHYNDGVILRLLVTFLWVLDTVHLALICHTIYFYAVTNFANPLAMLSVTKSIMAHVIITGISDVTVRGIFAYRVWLVSQGKKLLVASIVVPTLLCFAGSIAFPIRGLQIGTYAGFAQISWILYSAFVTGVVADSIIAAALCYNLARRRTGVRRTDSIVQVLMIYSINTGVLTSLCALCVLVMYATMPSNFVFIAFYFVLPKLFLNSLLATLNARERLRGFGKSTGGVVSIPLSATGGQNRSATQPVGMNTDTRLLEIQIQTAVDTKTDPAQGIEKKWRESYSPT